MIHRSKQQERLRHNRFAKLTIRVEATGSLALTLVLYRRWFAGMAGLLPVSPAHRRIFYQK
jgi:hypothetical protein